MRIHSLLWVFVITVVLVLVRGGHAFAWGTGHIAHGKLVRRVLPKEIQSLVKPGDWRSFESTYVEYPDLAFDPSARSSLPYGDYFQQQMTRFGITDTHAGIIPYFSLLIDCFRSGEISKAMLWAGCIAHLVGDAYSCNHWPLGQAVIYEYGSWLGWELRPGLRLSQVADADLDLGESIDGPLGREVGRLMASYRPQLRGKDPNDAALDLYVESFSADFPMQELEAPLLDAIDQIGRGTGPFVPQDPNVAKVLGRVAEACTRSAADFIYTAYVLAHRPPQALDVARVEARGRAKAETLERRRTLSNTAAYRGLVLDARRRAVGVIACALGGNWNNPGMAYGSIWFDAALLRFLHQRGIPYQVLQADRPGSWNLDPSRIPIVIACELQSSAYFDATAGNEALKSYLAKGGKILYLGGDIPPYLPALVSRLDSTSGRYPLDASHTEGARVLTSSRLGGRQYIFRWNMTGNEFDGGRILSAPWRFTAESTHGVEPLVRMVADGEEVVVGAGQVAPNGGLRAAMVPLFLLYPGAMSGGHQLTSFAHPALDPAGGRLLVDLLTALDDGKRMIPRLASRAEESQQ